MSTLSAAHAPTHAPTHVPSRVRAPFGAAVDRARLAVVPRRRVRAPRMPFVTLVSLVLLGGVVGLLCFNTQMQQASFAASTLEERAANLSARQQTLHSELQALQAPQHLAVAAAKVGMVAPQNACTLTLGGGPATDTCTPATRGPNTPPVFGPPPAKPAVLDPKPVRVTAQGQRGPDRRLDAGARRSPDRAGDTARR